MAHSTLVHDLLFGPFLVKCTMCPASLTGQWPPCSDPQARGPRSMTAPSVPPSHIRVGSSPRDSVAPAGSWPSHLCWDALLNKHASLLPANLALQLVLMRARSVPCPTPESESGVPAKALRTLSEHATLGAVRTQHVARQLALQFVLKKARIFLDSARRVSKV